MIHIAPVRIMPTLGVLMTFILSNRIGAARPCIPPFTVQIFTVIRSYGLSAALAYLLYYAVWGCKNVNKDIPVD